VYSQYDIAWLSSSLASIYSAKNVTDLSREMSNAVDGRFRLLASACEEFGTGVSFYMLHGYRFGVAPPRDYASFIHDNPLGLQLSGNVKPAVMHLRESVTLERWARTDHYNGLARPMGFCDQIVVVAQAAPTTAILGLYRDWKFTRLERDLAALLQPHIVAAWRRLRAIAFDPGSGPLRINLDSNLNPTALSEDVRKVLKAYFIDAGEGDQLPPSVVSWVMHSAKELRTNPEMRPLRALSAESIRGKLLIRFFPPDAGGFISLILVEVPAVPNFLGLQRMGLTRRECEVMYWLSLGKRDSEIASIMGTAIRTISKHVENLLRKFGAINRTAAVTVAAHWLQGPPGD
jgi:DNA-binding CsgD family transcriptional regulator